MLASRLGIAALVLIGLYGLLAVRPFGSSQPADAAGEPEVKDDLNLSLEELPTGEPAIHLDGPEGSETYVLRRLPNGEMAITRAEPDEATPSEGDVIAEKEDQRLRLDLDDARSAAMSARAQQLADDALQLRDSMDQVLEPDTDEGVTNDASSDAFEAMVRSALDRSTTPTTRSAPPPVSDPFSGGTADLNQTTEVDGSEAIQPPPPNESLSALHTLEARYEGKTLMGEDFSGQDLAGMSFKRAILTGADFTYANLTGASFTGARLQGAYFNDANLIDADMRGVSAQAAKFIGADMRRADLENANLTGADLTNADLRGAITTKVVLNGVVDDGTRFDPVATSGLSKRRPPPIVLN